MDYGEAFTNRQLTSNALDITQTAVNPRSAPSFEQQIVSVVLQAIAAADLEEGSSPADAAENLLNQAILIRLRVHLKPAKTGIVGCHRSDFLVQCSEFAVRDCPNEAGM